MRQTLEFTTVLKARLAFQNRHFCPCAGRYLLLAWWQDSLITRSKARGIVRPCPWTSESDELADAVMPLDFCG